MFNFLADGSAVTSDTLGTGGINVMLPRWTFYTATWKYVLILPD